MTSNPTEKMLKYIYLSMYEKIQIEGNKACYVNSK